VKFTNSQHGKPPLLLTGAHCPDRTSIHYAFSHTKGRYRSSCDKKDVRNVCTPRTAGAARLLEESN
jgi:hypothetical protein